MKILLINANPVVSRMLALCTRDENTVLDEVKRADAVKESGYDVLFVNDASYTDQVDALLSSKHIRKKVFISYDEEAVEGFDLTIKKPFLPSQITDIIESIDMSEEVEESEEALLHDIDDFEEDEQVEELPSIFPLSTTEDEEIEESIEESVPEVLDSNEIEKIKALLDMDDEIAENEPVDDDEYEARKVKIIKEQLIADGLEIIEEDAIVEVLSTTDTESLKNAKKKKKKRKFRDNPFSKKELARIEAAVEEALENMKPKKLKKLRKGKKVEIKIQLEDKQ